MSLKRREPDTQVQAQDKYMYIQKILAKRKQNDIEINDGSYLLAWMREVTKIEIWKIITNTDYQRKHVKRLMRKRCNPSHQN